VSRDRPRRSCDREDRVPIALARSSTARPSPLGTGGGRQAR